MESIVNYSKFITIKKNYYFFFYVIIIIVIH